MARITVEDCLEKVDNQYDLVLLTKERTYQLGSGAEALVPEDNDKRTVISLREIGEGKISPKELEEKAINKLRKYPNDVLDDSDSLDEIEDDEFDKIYKGEVSKSGDAILPSKRTRKIPVQEFPISEDDKENLESIEKTEEQNNKLETDQEQNN